MSSNDTNGSMKDFLESIDKAMEAYYGPQQHSTADKMVPRLTANQVRWRKQRINRILRNQGKIPLKPLNEKDVNGGYTLDPNGPTDHAPGTENKLLVLEDRARRGVALFHPDDCRFDASLIDCYRYAHTGPRRNSKRKRA